MNETIDVQKVAAMADELARQRADYMSLVDRTHEARTAAGRARAELFADPLIESPLAHATADDLERTPLDELEAAGITLRAVKALIVAERRSKALAAQAERAASELRHGRELLDSIETYLRQQGITV